MLRVSHERERRGWSKAKFSREADLNQVTVYDIESGRLRPYQGQLLKLAAALGWPPERAHELLEEVEAER